MGHPLSAKTELGQDNVGKLSCDGHSLRYNCGEDSWQIPVKHVRLIGEHATQSGAALDDYVIVIFPQGSNDWYEVPCSAFSASAIWLLLRKAFPGLAAAGFANAEFNSRALWPPEVAGHRLFDCQRMMRGERFIDRVLDAICPTYILTRELVPEFRVDEHHGHEGAGR
ncbi:MAG TPA: hypothetical protein VGL42_00945 [Opitutaceae bacterium]|jgi:hypothetical protein